MTIIRLRNVRVVQPQCNAKRGVQFGSRPPRVARSSSVLPLIWSAGGVIRPRLRAAMKDQLHSLVRGLDPLVGRNVVREYLQARMLEGLQRAGATSPLALWGGTALRFLYGLGRYSEDLVFALGGRAGSMTCVAGCGRSRGSSGWRATRLKQDAPFVRERRAQRVAAHGVPHPDDEAGRPRTPRWGNPSRLSCICAYASTRSRAS